MTHAAVPSSASARADRRPSPAALEVRDLTGPRGSSVVRGVSLTVPRGETHVVLGPSHSGKSMLMRLMLGLEPADRGVVTCDGQSFDAAHLEEGALAAFRRRVGVVFEGSALLSRATVVENIELPLLEHEAVEIPEARDTAHKLLAEAGLKVDEDTLPSQLTRADQRRVALARALALQPALLLLDEPALGLDPHAAHEFDATVERLQAGHHCGVLILSHQSRYVFTRATRIYVMVDGEIVARGDRDEVRASAHPVVRQMLERRGSR